MQFHQQAREKHSFDHDFLMACRYGYYVTHMHIVDDRYYDELEDNYKMINGDVPVGSERPEDYTPAQRALYLYFALSGRIVHKSEDLALL